MLHLKIFANTLNSDNHGFLTCIRNFLGLSLTYRQDDSNEDNIGFIRSIPA
jgi:hypothetical protein